MLKLENNNADDSDLKPAAALEVVAEDRREEGRRPHQPAWQRAAIQARLNGQA